MATSGADRLVCSVPGAAGPSGSPLGCTTWVKDGAVPNEYGTWLYGRGGWCDGLQVDPWRTDVTKQVEQKVLMVFVSLPDVDVLICW